MGGKDTERVKIENHKRGRNFSFQIGMGSGYLKEAINKQNKSERGIKGRVSYVLFHIRTVKKITTSKS